MGFQGVDLARFLAGVVLLMLMVFLMVGLGLGSELLFFRFLLDPSVDQRSRLLLSFLRLLCFLDLRLWVFLLSLARFVLAWVSACGLCRLRYLLKLHRFLVKLLYFLNLCIFLILPFELNLAHMHRMLHVKVMIPHELRNAIPNVINLSHLHQQWYVVQ